MTTDKSGLAAAWRRTNDLLLAPFVVFPNLGLAAINGMVGATARLTERAVQATGGAFGIPGAFAERVSGRVADRTLHAAKVSTDFVGQAVRNAAGGMTGPGSNELLAKTVIDKTTATAALPLLTGWDAVLAARDVPAIRHAARELWIDLNLFLDTRSSFGVLKGRERAASDSLIRFGFLYMATEGPLGAVWRDFHGIVGGVLALGMGDFQWLAEGAKGYWHSMEYVYDKWLAGETQPKMNFPISALLAWEARQIIQRFPWPFFEALRSGDPLRVLQMLRANAGEITTLLSLYPFTAFQVTYDVVVFILKAWLQVADALTYALCELAIVESDISDADKEFALKRLKETAGNATMEFQYYVPVLVPRDGTAADQAHPTNFAGEPIHYPYTIAPSVFDESAIRRAQELNFAVIQLRAFLWLYRDYETALQKSYQETVRKFGQAAADRIAKAWNDGTAFYYPRTPEAKAELLELIRPRDGSHDVPRGPQEIKEIFYELLHYRGLLYVADLVCGIDPYRPEREERHSADWPEIAW